MTKFFKTSLISSAILLLLSFTASTVKPQENKPQEIKPAPPVLIAPPVEDIQRADGSVVPAEGSVMIRLINKTNAKIRYQFLGDLSNNQKILDAQSESKFVKLPVPVSLTFRRIDNGFLKVTLKPGNIQSFGAGVLEIELGETSDFDVDRISLWINPKGDIYLN